MQTLTEINPEYTSTRTTATDAEVTCLNCQTTVHWGASSWCPECGFYPTLNAQLALDLLEHQEAQEEIKTPLQMLLDVPAWVWMLAVGLVAIVFTSMVARVVIVPANPERGWWAAIQFSIGFLALGIAHLMAYFVAISKSDEIGPGDLWLKPVTIWQQVFSELPRYNMLVNTGCWGFTTAICALVVVGGIDYEAILEHFAPRKKADTSVSAAVAAQAAPVDTDGTMQEGMNEFSKAANVEKLNPAGSKALANNDDNTQQENLVQQPDGTEKLLTAECLIIGYTADNDKLNALLLASIVDKKLKFVGHLAADAIPEDARKELQYRVPQYHSNHSIVKCAFDAQWLEPVLMCLVSYQRATEQNRLTRMQLVELLQDIPQH